MVQYEMYFTNEYTEEIISDLCNIMKLPYSDEKVNKTKSALYVRIVVILIIFIHLLFVVLMLYQKL